MDDNEDRFAVPKRLGQACGVFAGASLGWKAGEVLGHTIDSHLPMALHDYAAGLTPALELAGAFGCAFAGYMLASRNPDKALLIAAGVIGAQGGQPFYEHFVHPASADLTSGATGMDEASAAAVVSPTELHEHGWIHNHTDSTDGLSTGSGDGYAVDDTGLDGVV